MAGRRHHLSPRHHLGFRRPQLEPVLCQGGAGGRHRSTAAREFLGGSGVVCVVQNTGWRRLAHGHRGRSEKAVAEVARGTIRSMADGPTCGRVASSVRRAMAYGEGGGGRRTLRRASQGPWEPVGGTSCPSGPPDSSARLLKALRRCRRPSIRAASMVVGGHDRDPDGLLDDDRGT
jgi:hypothetical protein